MKFSKWLKAALIRAIKTVAQTAIATIGTSAVMGDVNWIMVGSSSLLAGILSILTSQFIPIENRQKVVKKVYESLNKHGVFIFVEKIIGDNYDYSELYEKLYYDMKSINGYSIDEIRDKRLKLEGVLVPCTNQFNIDLLKQGGFSKVDIFWKDLNFVGYIAMK